MSAPVSEQSGRLAQSCLYLHSGLLVVDNLGRDAYVPTLRDEIAAIIRSLERIALGALATL